MQVIAVLMAGSLAAGLATWAVVLRWPRLDPSAPAGAVHAVGEEVRSEQLSFVRRRLDPAAATGLALTIGVGVIVLGGSLLAGLAVLVRSNPTLARIDRGAATWGADHATDASTSVLRLVTQAGATPIVVALVAIVIALSLRDRKVWTIAAFLVVVVVGQNLIANLIKVVVDRARPDLSPLAGFSGASFPSGHTTAAFATFMAIALVVGRGRAATVQASLAGLAIGLATTVGMTRVLLGVHWLTDVIAGAALGLAWFALCAIAFGGRLLRFGLPIEAGQRAAELDEISDSTVRKPSA